MKAQYSIGPDIIIAIAQAIGRIDLRTTVSLYTSSTNSPWIITIGESNWHRHLIVEQATVGLEGLNASLAILPASESDNFGYSIHTDRIDGRIELKDLIENGYISVKKALFPSKRKSGITTLAQLKSMFVGKRLHITDSVDSLFDVCNTGTCTDVFGLGNDFSVIMHMDEPFMGQYVCTVGFHVETVTPTFVEGPLLAEKGGRRKVEVIG